MDFKRIKKTMSIAVLSLVTANILSLSVASKTVTKTERLIMDNDAPSSANYSNPSGWYWEYYPKGCMGMSTYLTGSNHYKSDARRGLCVPFDTTFPMHGGTAYAWKWEGVDHTEHGDVVKLTIKINDLSFNAPYVEYIHNEYVPYGYPTSFGYWNQSELPGSLYCLGTRQLQNPAWGPYIIANGTHSYNYGYYMGADQVVYDLTYTRYISTK